MILLICYAITIIITNSSIFQGFRDFFKKISPNFFGLLFICPLCTGFWVGIFLHFTGTPIHNIEFQYTLLSYIASGSLSGAVSLFINSLQQMIYYKSDNGKNEMAAVLLNELSAINNDEKKS